MSFAVAFTTCLPLQSTSWLSTRTNDRGSRTLLHRTHTRRRPRTSRLLIFSSAAASTPAAQPPAQPSSHNESSSSPSPTISIAPQSLEDVPAKLKLPPAKAASTFSTLLQRLSTFSKTEPFLRVRLVAALILMVISKVVGVQVPILFKRTIDALSTLKPITASASHLQVFGLLANAAFKPIALLLIVYSSARIIADITYELRNAVFAKAGQRLGRRLTRDAFEKIHTLGAAWYASIASGAVSRAVDRGTRSVLVIFRALVFGFVPSIFEFLLVLGVMASRGWYAGVGVVVLMFVSFVAWTLSINDRVGKLRRTMNALDMEASAKLTDSLINYEAVATFGNADFEKRRYDKCLEALEQASVKNEWQYALLNTGQKGIFAIGLTVVFFMTALDIMTGVKTVGDMAMIAIMLKQLWVPLNFLGWQYRELKQSLVDLQNLFDLVETTPTVVEKEGAPALQVAGGSIVFDNVTFSYPQQQSKKYMTQFAKDSLQNSEEQTHTSGALDGAKKVTSTGPIIRNLSFKVPPGKTFAIVGESGSGKSTALRLLYRLYDIESGRILIDGQDISEVNLKSLRDNIAMVPQDTILMNDTIAYNIAYGRPSATMEEIIKAAKAASIHDTIMKMKDGYQTIAGERGVRLSGGERQRISAARSFLKNSKIVLQDEATSALDSKTEAVVTSALKSLGRNRTTLIVAHRLSTVFDADWIIVMQKGIVVEEGTHRSLLRISNGIYKAMWERQQDYSYEEEKGENGVDSVVREHKIDEEFGELDDVTEDRDSETVDGRGYKDELARKYT